MITVSVSGIEGVQQVMAKLVPASEQSITELAERVFVLAVKGAEKHRKKGALVDSLGHGPKKIPGGYEIGHNLQRAPHAVFVHWGTKPHDIRPKSRKALRWTGGNGFIFAKFVHHPGYKGDPYLITAADQAIREFPRMVDKAMKGI